MDLVYIDNNDCSEAYSFPLKVTDREWAEEEGVLPCLRPPVPMGDATVRVHCTEETRGAAAEPSA